MAKVPTSLRRYLQLRSPILLDSPVHSFQPGDQVYLWTWKDEPLTEKWRGPYLVLLTRNTAVKLQGTDSWIHSTRVKAVPRETWKAEQVQPFRLKI